MRVYVRNLGGTPIGAAVTPPSPQADHRHKGREAEHEAAKCT